MSIQLILSWKSASELEWLWTSDSETGKGPLEQLISEQKRKNLSALTCRLLLPEVWFSHIDIDVPAKARRLTGETLKFACEDYLADDIDNVHLVLTGKPANGKASVLATNAEQLREILNTLKAQGIAVLQAYSRIPGEAGSQITDVHLEVQQQTVTVKHGGKQLQVHVSGFSQWFDLWSEQQALPEDATVLITSDDSEGPAKMLANELQVTGYQVQWLVEDEKSEALDADAFQHHPVNILQGAFSPTVRKTERKAWLPLAIAAAAATVVWLSYNVAVNMQLNSQIEQTWQANESVFLQVFGQNKRIQRPLMVREMRAAAAGNISADGAVLSSLQFLNDLTDAASEIEMEDFRFNLQRKEALFTLVISAQGSADAYSLFEQLNTRLKSKGYEVEYSANQDNDRFRARFKAVLEETV
ncbi:type II secretion system protein GspL [Reinekea marinisedimentorum]|uniref:Type II secretion system protein L n=1 Tax=Reinekea marinisedimentorum TaxID=230495 RepID=A0A4V2UK28_9GAMM|nr:type II secretion system protein GspL [Reinekea marinisedimentorum]TCS42536.1 type II secretory pathway component PulL [Reinekea marinisedimentorum]